MVRDDQQALLSREYSEALRYMKNAEDTLLKARKEGRNYIDKKYVRTACGTAYNGVLIAVDAWFVIKDIPQPPKKQRKSIGWYTSNIAKLDGKLLSDLEAVYSILHLFGYYDGITNVKVIADGFELAHDIIDRIKPEHPVEVAENRASKAKRIWNNLLVYAAVMFS